MPVYRNIIQHTCAGNLQFSKQNTGKFVKYIECNSFTVFADIQLIYECIEYIFELFIWTVIDACIASKIVIPHCFVRI